MPAIITHCIFAQELLKKLEERNITPSSTENYLWGTQGPDLLFFHRLMPWLFGTNYREYGGKIHADKPSVFFETLLDYIKNLPESEIPAALSYALGVCAHYALDSRAHPYIVCLENRCIKAAEKGADYHYHGEIESAIDLIVLKDWRGKSSAQLDLCECLPTDESTQRIISGAYKYLLDRIYKIDATKKACDDLVPDTLAIFKLLDDRSGKKFPVFKKLERLVGIKTAALTSYMRTENYDKKADYCNKNHALWSYDYEDGTDSHEDFNEIMKRALEFGVVFTEYFLAAFNGEPHDFAAFTQERSFSYGVPSRPDLQ